MISAEISSGPEDLPFFCLKTAFLISCSVIIASSSSFFGPGTSSSFKLLVSGMSPSRVLK